MLLVEVSNGGYPYLTQEVMQALDDSDARLKNLSMHFTNDDQVKQEFSSPQTIEQLDIYNISGFYLDKMICDSKLLSDFSRQLPLLTHLDIHLYINALSVLHILHNLIKLKALRVECCLVRSSLSDVDIEGMLQEDKAEVNCRLQDLRMVVMSYHEVCYLQEGNDGYPRKVVEVTNRFLGLVLQSCPALKVFDL